MDDYAQDLLDNSGYEDWEVEDDSILVCPHGNRIEWDGQSGDCGCISPLIEMGII